MNRTVQLLVMRQIVSVIIVVVIIVVEINNQLERGGRMGYWSDEREYLHKEMNLINQGALCRARENAELKEEIEELKMKIKNLKDEKENPTPIHRDQMLLPFSKWDHDHVISRVEPNGRWNWWGMDKVNNENPECES